MKRLLSIYIVLFAVCMFLVFNLFHIVDMGEWQSVRFFISTYAAGLTGMCVVKNLYFQVNMLHRFHSRKKLRNRMIIAELMTALVSSAVLGIISLLSYRLSGNIPDSIWINRTVDYLVSVFLASVQLALAGLLFRMNERKWMAQGGYLMAYLCCVMELAVVNRLAYQNLPFHIYLIFSWPLIVSGTVGKIIASIWIVIELWIIRKETERKDFL